jgi:eukaryotic-like serine/threonine-protein kinase
MSLSSGARLGPYEIIEPAGAGGMGEVYRARDVRLDRDVAVKTIRGPFSERFEREAQAISSLNHPHICTLYDVGEHEGSGYLVMEYIEGKPVAGPMPVEQAIAYGIEICEALHAAHRKGIVHRDLKPANILVTKQGVKLLDFGLAKLGARANASGAASESAEQATLAALTGAHTVVGTPQYMAPEQIEGKEVDARSDIFAFGCVLYELLTGQRAFEGKTASSVMASVLATTPRPIEQLVPLTPPALERIVTRCLAKDPEDRWQSARDVAAELQWVAQGGSRVGLPAIVTGRRKTREGLAWAACAAATLTAVGFAAAWMRRAPEPPELIKFPLPIPEGLSNPSTPEVSPDGRTIAFAAVNRDGVSQIWVRPMDALEAHPLGGTEGAIRLFWSPDSRQVAFMSGGKLKKADISGGPPQTICDAPRGSDGSWGSEGVILFDGRATDPIWRVPAVGGVAKVEVPSDPKNDVSSTGWPVFLPGGKRYLYMSYGNDQSDQTLMLGTLDSKDRKVVFKTTSRVLYAPPGYLLFVRENTLVAQKFDASTASVEGEAVPIGEGLGVDTVGLASFSVSRTGVLAYRAGDAEGHRLVWFDRAGKESPAIDALADYGDSSLSPDGKLLAFDATLNSTSLDIWIRDLARGVTQRFTFDPAAERIPLWSPDGRRIVFTSSAKGPGDLYIKDASGAQDAEVLLASPDFKIASDWSRDGAYLLYSDQGKETGWDMWALPMKGDRKPFPIRKTNFGELFATFSPDARFVAYQSNESGRAEVYVQEFPEARHKWQVSTSGGTTPYWRGDGRELFYRSSAGVMAVPVQTTPEFKAGNPTELFQAPFAVGLGRSHFWPTPDGQRFLVLAAPGNETVKPASILLNWTAALKN